MSQDVRKVLVVEDCAEIRRGLELLLQTLGFFVTVASTVAEGIARLDGHAIALLDLQLPDGNGNEIVREIRRRGTPMRIAIMTAGAAPALLEELQRSPPDRFFKKPLNVSALIDWLREEDEPRRADAIPA